MNESHRMTHFKCLIFNVSTTNRCMTLYSLVVCTRQIIIVK